VQRAARVDRLSEDWVQRDLADIGDGGEMHHGIAAAHRVGERLQVGELTDVGVDRLIVKRREDHVEDARLMAGLGELVDDVRPMKPDPPVTRMRCLMRASLAARD